MISSTVARPTHCRQVEISLQSKIELAQAPFSRFGQTAGQPIALGKSSPVMSPPQRPSFPPHALSMAPPNAVDARASVDATFGSALQAANDPAGVLPAFSRSCTHFCRATCSARANAADACAIVRLQWTGSACAVIADTDN